MATQREIKKRILSVTSTRKITNTMEMISASKMKKMQNRLNISRPFVQKIEQVINNLILSDIGIENEELMKQRENVSKCFILMISGNRGLCGGYNTNVIKNTLNFQETLSDEGKDSLLHVIGKKAINYLKFIDAPIYRSEINPEDKVTFKTAGTLGENLVNMYRSGEIDEVYVSYTKAVSSTMFKPAIYKLLPITIGDIHTEKDKMAARESQVPITGIIEFQQKYILTPNPEAIISMLFPYYLKMKLYINMLESSFAEQFSRRVAMKNATDAASDMVRLLTIKYNRARQAKITNEIAEIVGGASALE